MILENGIIDNSFMKKKIIHLSSFESLGVLHTAFKSLFTLLNRNFDEIVILNIDNLKMFKKKSLIIMIQKLKKFPKSEILNPKILENFNLS